MNARDQHRLVASPLFWRMGMFSYAFIQHFARPPHITSPINWSFTPVQGIEGQVVLVTMAVKEEGLPATAGGV